MPERPGPSDVSGARRLFPFLVAVALIVLLVINIWEHDVLGCVIFALLLASRAVEPLVKAWRRTRVSGAQADAFAHFAAAIERREDLIEDLVDRLLELWNEADDPRPFHEWAGLTSEQYAAYVTDRYEDAP